jgi:hypothetical protein
MTGNSLSPPRSAWWQNRWVLAALCLAVAIPIAVTSFPPLVDLYGHLGRYHIQAEIADNPVIQRYWSFHWALVANLGVDLLSVPLSRLIGLERAIWLIVLAIPPLMVFGLFRMARTVHGHIPASALAAVPFALAYPFQFGFVNFWLGTAIAFHVAASWIALSSRKAPRLRAAALFVPAGLVVWITHVYAWGILGVIAGGSEIGRSWQAGKRGLNDLLVRPAIKCLPLAAPMPLMLIWRSEGAGAVTEGWFNIPHKITDFAQALRDQSMIVDIASIALIAMLIYAALRTRKMAMSPLLGFPAAILFALAILFPYQLFGSAFADTRMWPVALAVAIVAIRIEPETGRAARTIALIAVAVCAVRIGAGTVGFSQYDRDFERHMAALDEVERGARIVVLVQYRCDRPWRWARLQHIGSLAIVRRDAFTNTQWNVPGAQLLQPLGGLGTPFNADPSQFVTDRTCPDDMRPRLYDRAAQIPRDRFDYVWVIDFDPGTLDMPDDLSPLYSDERTILYRIDRNQDS